MAARVPLRLSGRHLRQVAFRRNLATTSCFLDAQNFTMPAMSPTMTEGNIAGWKVKEGDSFSTGDVLLEIETDKATMDVEAQDDGIMAKIIQAEGTKGVQVGSRIAVLAEPDDDISSLEIPPEDSKSAPKQEKAKEESKPESSQQSESAPSKSSEAPKPASSSAKTPSGAGQNTKYPFYPAVTALIHEHHISETDIAKIPATGPNGRLLKGDVLSYLGRIQADYSSTQSKRIQHLAHMDLSNIKILPSPETKSPTTPETGTPSSVPAIPPETSISLPISLTEVLKVQNRIQDTLGVSIPLSTFLTRAVDIANDDLPKPKGAAPSANDLFNAVLGLDSLPPTSRGGYVPQIAALPSRPLPTSPKPRPKRTAKREPDIIDILTGHASTGKSTASAATSSQLGMTTTAAAAMNVFSITVPTGEETRARTFLERVKTVLQVEPGRLVL